MLNQSVEAFLQMLTGVSIAVPGDSPKQMRDTGLPAASVLQVRLSDRQVSTPVSVLEFCSGLALCVNNTSFLLQSSCAIARGTTAWTVERTN